METITKTSDAKAELTLLHHRDALLATSIKPTVQGERRALVNPLHVLAQLSQKGIRK